jgi:hypothetical protein
MKILNFFKHHWILSTVLVLIILIRIALPPLALKVINEGLESQSPIYQAHISDLDLSFLRMAYRFEGVDIMQKSTKRVFLKAQAIDVSVAWRDLFK